jgi:uncharacterized phage-associated protein
MPQNKGGACLALANSKETPDVHLATVVDAAKYIMHKVGPLVYLRLQTLCYYCQAWSLAWDEIPLFSDEFLAHSCGPICKELVESEDHPEYYYLSDGDYGEYDEFALSADQKENIDFVLDEYNAKRTRVLMALACSELPWLAARHGIPKDVDSDNVISKEEMEEYYAGQLLLENECSNGITKAGGTYLALANDPSDSKEKPDYQLATVVDVAKYILRKFGKTSRLRLQMLCYYFQAWSIAWSEIPLFGEELLAHSNGSFCKELNELEPKGAYFLNDGDCGEYDDTVLIAYQKRYIDIVLDEYKEYDTVDLMAMITAELPWLAARRGIPQEDDSDSVISREDMEEYYVGLLDAWPDEQKI